MFRKLLKYDMKSVWNVWRIMAITIFALSIVGSFVLRYILTHAEKMFDSPGLMLMFSGFMLCSLLSFFTACAVTVIFVFVRFYKNFFTDEGYLTFTLPVKRSTLLNAKTANAMIWGLLLIAFIIACAIPFSIISPPSENGELINLVIYEDIWDSIKSTWERNPLEFITAITWIVLMPTAAIFFGVNSIQFCMTVGALLVKRAKMLLGIGIFYLFFMGFGFLRQIINIVSMLFLRNRLDDFIYSTTDTLAAIYSVSNTVLIAAALFTFGFILYAITRACIERRLNLA